MDASVLNLKDITASKNANTRMSESTAAALKCRVKCAGGIAYLKR